MIIPIFSNIIVMAFYTVLNIGIITGLLTAGLYIVLMLSLRLRLISNN